MSGREVMCKAFKRHEKAIISALELRSLVMGLTTDNYVTTKDGTRLLIRHGVVGYRVAKQWKTTS